MLSSDDSSAVELSELSNTTRPRFRSRAPVTTLFSISGGQRFCFPDAPESCGELTEEGVDISGHKRRNVPYISETNTGLTAKTAILDIYTHLNMIQIYSLVPRPHPFGC